jgi:hypothetical protein
MIVRNINGVIKVIDVAFEDNDAFLAKNPTGGFMKVDNLPYARYGNWKMEGDEIVVDEVKEAEQATLQYQHDRQYPDVKEQLDMLFHAVDAGLFGELAKTSDFYITLKAVKDETPKPE